MKKKLLAGIVAILMAIPLLFISASPAQAACASAVSTSNDYAVVTDDDVNGYIRVYVYIYYYNCSGYNTFRYVRIGYAPDTRYNSTLHCGSGIGNIDRVRINLGAILGHNPEEWDSDCIGTGNARNYDWANTSLPDGSTADRCVGASWTADINFWNDRSGTVPATCF